MLSLIEIILSGQLAHGQRGAGGLVLGRAAGEAVELVADLDGIVPGRSRPTRPSPRRPEHVQLERRADRQQGVRRHSATGEHDPSGATSARRKPAVGAVAERRSTSPARSAGGSVSSAGWNSSPAMRPSASTCSWTTSGGPGPSRRAGDRTRCERLDADGRPRSGADRGQDLAQVLDRDLLEEGVGERLLVSGRRVSEPARRPRRAPDGPGPSGTGRRRRRHRRRLSATEVVLSSSSDEHAARRRRARRPPADAGACSRRYASAAVSTRRAGSWR